MKRLSGRVLPNALCALLVWGLAACGGGGGGGSDAPTPPAVVAGADTLTIATGQSGNLLANDTIAGAAATAGAAGNVSFSITTGTPPTGVTVTDGTVAVATSTVPGAFTLTYRICQATSTTNCATATA